MYRVLGAKYNRMQDRAVSVIDGYQRKWFLRALNANNLAVMNEVTEQVQCIGKEFRLTCRRRKLRGNVENIKTLLVCKRGISHELTVDTNKHWSCLNTLVAFRYKTCTKYTKSLQRSTKDMKIQVLEVQINFGASKQTFTRLSNHDDKKTNYLRSMRYVTI